MNILSVVGARPNFVKLAALHRIWQQTPGIRHTIVHTGQHEDWAMSGVFFEELNLPAPDYHLSAGAQAPLQQLGTMLQGLAPILADERPDWVVVVGDTTSTLAGALAAAQTHTPLAHVEAGLRSGDRSMPEELNRVVCDQLATLLFVTEPAGVQNLVHEGVDPERIHLVGNCMIDTLLYHLQQPVYEQLPAPASAPYLLWTLHRPANVDHPQAWEHWLKLLEQVCKEWLVFWPLHPRTRRRLEDFGGLERLTQHPNLHVLPPQSYLKFIRLMSGATAVVTDSGGIQEETTALGVTCLTLRPNTERPITVESGTNTLLPDADAVTLLESLRNIQAGRWKTGQCPAWWDGRAAERITEVLWQNGSLSPNP